MTSLALNEHLTLFAVKDGAVLFSKNNQQLYGLDPQTALLLLRLANGESFAELIGLFGSNKETIGVMTQLSALLAGDDSGQPDPHQDRVCLLKKHHNFSATGYLLLGTRFTLAGPNHLLNQWILPFLAHLEEVDSDIVDLQVIIRADGDRWSLTMNDMVQARNLPAENLLPLLLNRLCRVAYLNHDYLIALHAAAASHLNQVFIFPAVSGSGKSTLVAAMLARGLRLFSDDTALIDSQTSGVIQLPLPGGLKEGSWPLMVETYPELRTLPVHTRHDGLKVKFLPVAKSQLAAVKIGKARQLIFPRFSAEATPQINPLSPVQALQGITEAGYQVNGLDNQKVKKILTWILGLDCYAMTYSSTEEAFDLLASVIPDFPPEPV